MDSSPAFSSMVNDPIMTQVNVADDDRTSEEDVCSICLDAFDSHDNPPTVTTCKHAFHLQCILEWSQRSKECPICWQLIVLKDPASQELLSMVEDERSMRSVLTVRHVYEDPEIDHDIEEEMMRRFGIRRHRQRVSGVGPSAPRADSSIRQEKEMYTSLEEFQDNVESSSSVSNRDCTRVVNNESPNGNGNGSPVRPIAADMHAFSESVKSKFSAASARYKESISKSTQGLKEKLLSNNSPVKELSREMSAGFARIFERLDPSSKRPSPSSNSSQDNVAPLHPESTENFSSN